MAIYWPILHRLYSFFIPPIGFFLNILLVWLIAKKTPKEMQTHGWILIQTCVLDLLMLAIGTFALPFRLASNDGTIVVPFEAFLLNFLKAFLNPTGFYCLYLVYSSIYTFNLFGLTVQFLYRYLHLNHDIRISIGRYLQMILVPLILDAILTAMTFQSSIGSLNSKQIDFELFDGINPEQTFFITFNHEDNLVTKLDVIILSALQIVCYLLITFSAIQMIRYLRRQTDHSALMAQRNAMNKQIGRNLIILASFPSILVIGSLFVSVFIFIYSPNQGNSSLGKDHLFMQLTFALTLFGVFLPILNPLASLITIRPYRDIILARVSRIQIHPHS